MSKNDVIEFDWSKALFIEKLFMKFSMIGQKSTKKCQT